MTIQPSLALVRACTLAYAFLSAALYCSLMPLWEGFDELYHYACVQHVSTSWSFPVIGETRLSRELWASLDFLPVSHYLQPYLGRSSTSFDQYFRLSGEQRRALRRGVDSIDPAWRREASPRVTYEAMQAPLTYVLLAPLDGALAGASLITRVLALRLALSFLTIALLWIGTRRLARRLGLSGPMEAGCLLVVFSCQMLYAATCRVGNDALAAPWLVFLLVAVMDSVAAPELRRTAWVALLMGIGLLIKASLLVFVPLVFLAPVTLAIRRTASAAQAARHMALAAALLAVLAGPWYLRNLRLYHNLTATVESTSGVGVRELLDAAAGLPWFRSIAETAHGALWTGNNSFTTFSGSTLNAMLGVAAVGIALYCFRARFTWPERITVLAITLYCAGLVIVALSFFYSSHGRAIGPVPWYLSVLFVPVLALVFLGFARQTRWGRWIGIGMALLWTYVTVVSWVAKLLPLYGGLAQSHARLGQLWHWYLEGGAQRNSVLSSLCPAPAPVLYVLVAGVLGTALVGVGSLVSVCHRSGERID